MADRNAAESTTHGKPAHQESTFGSVEQSDAEQAAPESTGERVLSKGRGRQSTVDGPEGVVCEECTRVVDAEQDQCSRCNADRPPGGWTSAQDCDDEWLGCIIDDTYKILSLVGQGGMGQVYKGKSMNVARDFALKIVDPKQPDDSGHSEESIRDRLKREIDAQSTLRNPHVVPLFDALLLPRDRVAIVMDFIDGETVRELVYREGALPVERACAITRQIANGLQEAHDAGMIHRDLKPSNIMVESLPAGDQFVRVFDFGVVSISGDTSCTHGFVGTPLYASPEQARGDELDRRSDIYSLGAVFFCMLTGRPPFVYEELYEALNAHVNETAPRLGQALPERVFPDSLEDLVARMLSKDPDQRPSSMAQLITELDALASTFAPSPTSLSEESYSLAEERTNADTIVPASKEDSTPLVEQSSEVGDVIEEVIEPFAENDDEDACVPGAQILIEPERKLDDA